MWTAIGVRIDGTPPDPRAGVVPPSATKRWSGSGHRSATTREGHSPTTSPPRSTGWRTYRGASSRSSPPTSPATSNWSGDVPPYAADLETAERLSTSLGDQVRHVTRSSMNASPPSPLRVGQTATSSPPIWTSSRPRCAGRSMISPPRTTSAADARRPRHQRRHRSNSFVPSRPTYGPWRSGAVIASQTLRTWPFPRSTHSAPHRTSTHSPGHGPADDPDPPRSDRPGPTCAADGPRRLRRTAGPTRRTTRTARGVPRQGRRQGIGRSGSRSMPPSRPPERCCGRPRVTSKKMRNGSSATTNGS